MSSLAQSPAHIPAWKRIGLKLKSAQAVDSTVAEAQDSPKRKRDDVAAGSSISTKKKHKSTPSSALSVSTPEPKRRKSVTFTPDTKREDGESIKKLFSQWVSDQQAWEEFQNTPAPSKPQISETSKVDDTKDKSKDLDAITPSISVSSDKGKDDTTRKGSTSKKNSENPATDTAEAALNKPKAPKSKKSKAKKESAESEKPAVQKTEINPALRYLRSFQEERDKWKFNKNHQTYLLKNLYDFDRIPVEYSESLYLYLTGLKGQVRNRVRADAIAARASDGEAMDKDQDKENEYQDALAKHLANMRTSEDSSTRSEQTILQGLSSDILKSRLGKRMRSERIIQEMVSDSDDNASRSGTNTLMDEEGQSSKLQKLNDGSKATTRRKRKQRTTAVDDSSSSSSSSESSSEESSSDSDSGTETDTSSSDTDTDTDSESDSDSASADDAESSSSSSSSDDSSSSSSDSESGTEAGNAKASGSKDANGNVESSEDSDDSDAD